jgi:NitT/TauT family transport system substrate-binding protein
MKKLLLVAFIAILAMSLIACNETTEEMPEETEATEETVETVEEEVNDPDEEEIINEKIEVNVAGLNGPTSMGMIKLFEDYTNPGENIEINYTNASAPDQLVGKLIQGELDFAAVPTNLASVIYNKTEGAYQLTNVNTLNVIYILTNGIEINSIKDLKGKTVHISGKGATPDYMMKYLLSENGLDSDEDVVLDFSLDHASLAQALSAGDVEIAVLPQPFVTTVRMNNPDVKVAVDLLDEWEAVAGDALFAMGGLVVRTEFAKEHPEIVEAFLGMYDESVAYVNKNPKAAAALVEKHGILPKAKIAELAIPLSNIVYMDAYENKDAINEYYQILYDFNKASVGGQLPDDSFYYQK